MNIEQASARLRDLEKRMHAYQHAMSLLGVDGMTVAPEKSYIGRGETLGILSGDRYSMFINDETGELLDFLAEHSAEISDPAILREAELLREDYVKTKAFPKEEFVRYSMLLNEADAVWHKAKADSDYALFEPVLKEIISFNRNMAEWYAPGQDKYDTLLNEYEKGAYQKDLDVFFEKVRKTVVPLVNEIAKVQDRVDDSFLKGYFPVDKQRKLSKYLMDLMGIDPACCTLGETEHPFTDGFNKYDVRITTKYLEDDFLSSMYSVIHEGGHAIYEMGYDDSCNYTVLAGGASCAMHESQSRFYENIIGRSEGFISCIAPFLRDLFPENLAGVSDRDLYRAANKSVPSLIRTDADELTYPLHIMVRYEIEKALIDGSLSTKDLPGEWNRLYKEYLGVDVPDDRRGVLQDSHWSGGSFGYFPSYALGSAYGAQMLSSMKKDLDFDALTACGNILPMKEWLTEKIYRYGVLLRPEELIMNSCGEAFDASYYTDYLEKKYTGIYNL